MSNWNTTFKRPTGALPDTPRSPPPPRAYVEPLSPPGLRPVEPLFNYPAVNNSANHAVRTDQAYNATPKPRSQSLQQESSRHKRTPSTIDTLAEAAFALSPSFQTHARKGSTASQQNGPSTTYSYGAAYGATEPPHKRSRSDYLPSPLVGPYAASRPATSYGYGHAARPATHYSESRVEEAALLLNIRTGGSTAMSPPARPAQPAVQRPHANSFPRDVYHSRTANASTHAQTPLLPPFSPHQTQSPRPGSYAQHQSRDVPDRAAKVEQATPAQLPRAQALNFTTITKLEQNSDKSERPQAPQHVHADETVSRGDSTDVAMSETSEASKTRPTGTKGKSKNVTKKSAMEKATSKRAVSRKKTPNPAKAAKKTKAGPIDSQAEANFVRRKSMSDAIYRPGTVNSGISSRNASVPPENGMLIREASREKPGRRRGDVTSETICSGCFTSRERTASSELDEWISCNGCKKWFHIDCAGFKKAHEVRDVDKFFCKTCEPAHGKTTYVRKSARAHASVDYAELQRGVLKTSEESMEHHYIQPIKDGTLFPFDRESFPRIRPELVTREFFEKSGTFVEPICIPAEWNPRPWEERAGKGKDFDKVAAAGRSPADATADLYPEDFEYDSVRDDGQDKLDMVMPEGLSVRQVCNLVGPEYPLDVIDVKTQNSGAKMNLAKWADYYEEESEDKQIRNVISLEVSQSKLGRLLRRPKVVRDIDLQDQVWPQEETDKGKYPKVQYYCLMSIADSYTDFHIDFGGSSVYYHILKGKKTFFFIPPKPKHLKAYEEWNESPQQNFTFLGNITGECYRVDLKEGDTMLIPSGWIHAVWTPETSLVIGGNFLTRMSYKNQFKVVEIEKANKTPMKFRYPFFQKIMFYTALKYLKEDPLPPSVSQMFYEGKQFHREQPIWQDFDGRLAAKDARPEAQNSRYYSQAELEGLPDLALYLYHVVLAVLGLREGISADQMKRMNASIPKGHGEPLEVAKTFALWVAWKTGEPAPAFAHPDALLDTIRDEGPPKKLSARAIKDLERKEAFAAYKVAPDRQSERVMSQKVAAAVATNGVAPSTAPAPPPPEQPPSNHHQQPSFAHQPYHQPSPSLPPSALMMAGSPGQYISTPKTSVLGPKRVACDACRKRRIKCKHKDMVVQASPNGFHQVNGIAQDGSFQSNLAPELHDNITVSSPKPASDGTNGQLNGAS
ncbi:Clavaminate synthase-like protein, partial [Hortaea werneckii]